MFLQIGQRRLTALHRSNLYSADDALARRLPYLGRNHSQRDMGVFRGEPHALAGMAVIQFGPHLRRYAQYMRPEQSYTLCYALFISELHRKYAVKLAERTRNGVRAERWDEERRREQADRRCRFCSSGARGYRCNSYGEYGA